MARLSLSLFILSVCLAASPVHLIVPPKTPVLSGFQPAVAGKNRELVCDAYRPNAGNITYTWYKYQPVDSRRRTWEITGQKGTGQKIIFNSIRRWSNGKYKCRASNSAGTRDSDWEDLYVYTPCSHYTVSVSPAISVVGSTFTVNCYIPNPSGFAVYWTKQTDTSSPVLEAGVANREGCHAPNNTRFTWSSCSPPSLSSNTNTFILQITNAATSDFAFWRCKDIGLNCTSDPLKPVILAQNGIPQIAGFPTAPAVVAGAQVNLTCVASPPGDAYDWYKNGTKLTTSLSYDLHVKKESAGVYKCVARNATASATSSEKTMVVYYKADSVVVSSAKNFSGHRGETDRFICTATGGYPTPYLRALKKGLIESSGSVGTDSDYVMAKWDNHREFYCKANVNGYPALDMTSTRITYDVTFPNTKVSFINNPKAAVQVGQVKTFTCETDESHPVTSIKWYQSVGGSWQDVTSGITSSERSGEYGGKIRTSVWSVTATTAMNGRTVRCVSFYPLTGHRLAVLADTSMSVKDRGAHDDMEIPYDEAELENPYAELNIMPVVGHL